MKTFIVRLIINLVFYFIRRLNSLLVYKFYKLFYKHRAI